MVHRGRRTCLIRARRSLRLATAGHNRLPSHRANTRLATVSIQRPAAALCHARKQLPGAETRSRRGDKVIAKRLKAQKHILFWLGDDAPWYTARASASRQFRRKNAQRLLPAPFDRAPDIELRRYCVALQGDTLQGPKV